MRWARESAGLSLDEAARAVIGGARAIERLADLENGRSDPTRAQLCAMAKRYHRPLLTFYLSSPPVAAERTHDFRTMPTRDTGMEGILDALVRDVRARQGLVRAALEDSDEAEPLPFVGATQMPQAVQTFADLITKTWSLNVVTFRAAPTVDEAFKVFRDSVERSGVFVILQGNLGHYTTNISAGVFRGFTLSDPIAPFIVINETDARAAWAFTLLHELGHVLLGQSGISGYDGDAAVERLCDAAAARILLGPDGVKDVLVSRETTFDEVLKAVSDFAGRRKLSRKMVAYNLLRSGLIDAAAYARLSARLEEERANTERQRSSGGGGDYFVTRRHRVGPGLIRLVDRMVAGGALSSTKAGRVLGVKPTAVGRMTADPRAA